MITSSDLNSISRKIDVSPDMSFYSLLESFSYTVKNALSEYIDNALEAYRKAKKNQIPDLADILTITINISKERIIIDDNGTGIPISEIQRAMKPAHKSNEQSLSEFGIGMKAASFWFGKKWTLKSYPLDRSQPFSLVLDLEELIKQEKNEININDIEQRNYTGVEIILENLNNEIDLDQAKRVWIDLQETYQLFCSRKDPQPILKLLFKYNDKTLAEKDFSKLTVANESLEFPLCKLISKLKDSQLYAIGPKRKWKENIEFMFNQKKVHGFISLGKESSQALNPGLRLFRFGRLIKGTSTTPNRPTTLLGTANKHAPSRFYAELHLDGQAISNSKGDFIFDEYLFLNELKKIPCVTEFIDQAENYRSTKVEKDDYISLKTEEEFEKIINKKPSRAKKYNKKRENTPNNESNSIANDSSNSKNKPEINDINSAINKTNSNTTQSLPNNQSETNIGDNIQFSEELFNYLSQLQVDKFSKFYKSICRIPLTKDPLVAYVCAWSLLDSLKSFFTNSSKQTEFTAFFNEKSGKMLAGQHPNNKKKFTHVLKDIHEKGNLCKHDGEYTIINAQQLINDFKILEKLIIFCIEENLKNISK